MRFFEIYLTHFRQFDIMIRIILVTLFFLGVSQANNCFDRSDCIYTSGPSLTNYHCIIRCANSLTKETMDMLLDNMQDNDQRMYCFLGYVGYIWLFQRIHIWYIQLKIPKFFIDLQLENKIIMHTMFEDHRKSLIQHCERSELRLDFEWTKVN